MANMDSQWPGSDGPGSDCPFENDILMSYLLWGFQRRLAVLEMPARKPTL